MKPLLVIDELREIRRQLAEEQMLDVERYAAMLRKVADASPGRYVDKPLVPQEVRQVDSQVKSAKSPCAILRHQERVEEEQAR